MCLCGHCIVVFLFLTDKHLLKLIWSILNRSNYQFFKSNSKVNLTILQQEVDFSLSTHIRPARANSEVQSFFNLGNYFLGFAKNYNIGELIQRMISIKIEPKELSTFSTYFQLDWMKDKYYVNLATTSFTAIGIPIYIDNQDLNIIGKEAINLRFGLNILKNNWLLSASFSQHIPYKIDLREKIIPPQEEVKEKIYGGGLFHVSLIKYLVRL